MKTHGHPKHVGASVSSNPYWGWIKRNTLLLGIASLIWLVFKSGPKPSRIQYPCQKAAATNVSIFILPFLLPLMQRTYGYLKRCPWRQVIKFLVATAISMGMISIAAHLWTRHQNAQQLKYYNQLKVSGPFGKKVASGSTIATGFLTIPHAMALPSLHRVVSVHDADATSWDFCTSNCDPSYYGDDAYVDQDVVDQMVDRGMRELTGTETLAAAWQVILPDYQAGEVVAIKVNFNCAGSYTDSDDYVDALPQVVNSVIAGLIVRGVAQDNIWVFDSSRRITNRFRALIDYPGVRYYDRSGNGDDVRASTFDSELASSNIDFTNSGYPASWSTHKISDVLIDSDYLINIPIMKKHGGAGITLSLKNHLGSINGFISGSHDMHEYFYLSRSRYDAERNPIVDINNNTHIRDKTVLIIGDALYAGWRSNNTPPERWDSFDNDSPNMLFFAGDPVAVDSVMFDYIDREGSVYPASEDILVVAANAGLGVHERWNNDSQRQYSTIDYIEIDLDDGEAPSVPTDLSASVISDSQIDLSWSASTDADSSVDGYNIYRDGTRIDATTDTTFSDTGLSPDTQYTYAVTAYDTADNESAECPAVNATTHDAEVGTSPSESGGGGCFIHTLVFPAK